MLQPSVSIATQTTLKLVIKDYALEPDEHRIFSAAHLMVANLAGNLAHVSCKEPLHFSISSWLRSILQGSGLTNEIMEQVVQLVTEDNLELGCAIIAQAAADKPSRDTGLECDSLVTLVATGFVGSSQANIRFWQSSFRIQYFLSLSLQNQQFNQGTDSALAGHFSHALLGETYHKDSVHLHVN